MRRMLMGLTSLTGEPLDIYIARHLRDVAEHERAGYHKIQSNTPYLTSGRAWRDLTHRNKEGKLEWQLGNVSP